MLKNMNLNEVAILLFMSKLGYVFTLRQLLKKAVKMNFF